MALYFDGVDDALTAPLVLPQQVCTVSLWVRQASLANGVLFETYSIPPGWDRSIQVNSNGTVSCRIWENPGDFVTTSTVARIPSMWAHVLYRHGPDAGGQRLVVNGNAVVNPAQEGSKFDYQTHIRLAGGHYYSQAGLLMGELSFSGELAEFALWGVELSETDEAILTAGASPLLLTHRLGDLLAHHDLIRTPNRPGLGPSMSVTGSPTPAEHVPRVSPGSVLVPIGLHTQASAPRFSAVGTCWGTAAAAGECFNPAAEQGQAVIV